MLGSVVNTDAEECHMENTVSDVVGQLCFVCSVEDFQINIT